MRCASNWPDGFFFEGAGELVAVELGVDVDVAWAGVPGLVRALGAMLVVDVGMCTRERERGRERKSVETVTD